MSARFEAELVSLAPEERADFLRDLGLEAEHVGLPQLVQAAYEALDLITFFTVGMWLRCIETNVHTLPAQMPYHCETRT